uniref:Small ribosomal subunit protein uS3m n=1 Tax=Amanita phalloides TaxID=67723 RepID=A0A5Q0N2E8_AMAPH|nr:ribosomal protein S3 [Amanita phalloides]QFZ98663.1 ribosomal protein S3 [Amanita phalloides]
MKNYEIKNKISSNLNFTQACFFFSDANSILVSNSSKSLILNRNFQELNIDRRILPLFRTPILRLKIAEIQQNTRKYNLTSLLFSSAASKIKVRKGLQSKNNLNKKFTNQIFKIFIKALNLYNKNLKSFLLLKNKLNLILDIKNDKLYKLNTKISIFFNRVNKFNFEIKKETVLPKLNNNIKTVIEPFTTRGVDNNKSNTLFINSKTKELFNTPIYKLTEIINGSGLKKKLFISNISTENLNMEISNNKELIKFGKEILNELDFHISQNKFLINLIKNYNKVSDLIRNTSLLSLDKNNNLNYNLINSKARDVENYNSTNSSNLDFQKQEILYKNFLLTKMFNKITKSNEIKIENTINSIIKNQEFDYNTESISIKSNPISLEYSNNVLADNNNSPKASPIINKYLKALSKYNIKNHGITKYYSNIIGYKFNSDTNKFIKDIYKLLADSFKSMYCLISKPVIVISSNKIIIQLFYYLFIPNILKYKKIYKMRNKRRKNLRIYLTWKKRRNKIKRLYRKFRKININTRIKLRKLYLFNITKIYQDKFKTLCEILNNIFKKSVELDLIRLHYPYYDSNILVNLLAIMINRIKLRIIAKRLFGKAVLKNKKFSSKKTNKLEILPAFLSGINIKIAGRLLNNKIVPRKTVKTIRRGAVAKGKINYLDVARYTNKNKRGAYSITVSSGQNYF